MKNLPLIIGIVVVILLGIAGYWYMNQNPSSQSSAQGKKMAAQNTGSGMMSLKDLLALGTDQMCTFSTSNESGSVEGTSYISGGKVRSDFSGTYTDGTAYAGTMINDGSYMYTWTNDTNQGFKMALTDELNKTIEETKEDFANNPNKYINPDEKVDYKCSSWNADASMFVPPSNISFTDYSQMMQQLDSSQANPDMKAAQCQACDSMPEGEAKSMCKQSLGCN